MTMVVTAIYISKISSYSFPLQIDRNIYFWLSKVKFHVYYLARIFNISVALFMFSSLLCAKTVKKAGLSFVLMLSIPILAFVFLNDPSTTWSLYLAENSSHPEFARFICSITPYFNNLVIIFFIFMPLYFVCQYAKGSKIKFKRYYGISLSLSLLVLNIFFYVCIINDFSSPINFNNVDLLKFPTKIGIYRSAYFAPFFMTFLALLTVIFLSLYKNPFKSFIISSRYEMLKSIKIYNNNLNMMLHTYKNAFSSVSRLSETIKDSIENNDTKTALSCCKTLDSLASQHFETINKSLSMTKLSDMKFDKVDIVKCLSEAIDACSPPQSIKIITNNQTPELFVYGDYIRLREVMINLIENAITALDRKESEDKEIQVTTSYESDFVIIDIKDNGCGITPHDISKTFTPFYTTKPILASSGIGLYFVRNVINLHHGEVYVDSKVGEYTTFTVILPMYREKRRKL